MTKGQPSNQPSNQIPLDTDATQTTDIDTKAIAAAGDRRRPDPNVRGSEAYEDLGGGFRAAREGELPGQSSSASKPKPLRIGGYSRELGRPIRNDRDLSLAREARKAAEDRAARRERQSANQHQRQTNRAGFDQARQSLAGSHTEE